MSTPRNRNHQRRSRNNTEESLQRHFEDYHLWNWPCGYRVDYSASIRVQLFRSNCPMGVTVTAEILKLIHYHLKTSSTSMIEGSLCGNSIYDSESGKVTIAFDRLIIDDESSSKLEARINFRTRIGGDADNVDDDNDYRRAELMLRKTSTAKSEVISIDRFISLVKSKSTSDLNTIEFYLEILTLGTAFELSPLMDPLPDIIHTALALALVDPSGNAFLHSQPKSGYVTRNELKRLLLILDSDPKVISLPLVGVWISGVEKVNQPYVWAACARYIHASGLNVHPKRSSVPFLLIIYNNRTFRPSFYKCQVDTKSSMVDYFQTNHLFVRFSVGLNDLDVDSKRVFTAPLFQLVKNITRDIDQLTPRLRLSFDAVSTVNDPATSLEIIRQPSPLIQTTNANHGLNPTSPIPIQVIRLLEAQEHQLKELRRRVDDLSRNSKSNSQVSQDLSVEKSNSLKVTTATMTSFVFPPLSSSAPLMNRHHNESEVGAIQELENERRTISTTFQSLADLKLDSLLLSTEQSAFDWQKPNSSVVTTSALLQIEDCTSILSTDGGHQNVTSGHLVEDRIQDEHFYENILKRVQTILSHQSTDGVKLDVSKSDISKPSVFDSLFLPRLNYVSLRLDDDDDDDDGDDYSRDIFKKYLVDHQETHDNNTEMSLDTLRYLQNDACIACMLVSERSFRLGSFTQQSPLKKNSQKRT